MKDITKIDFSKGNVTEIKDMDVKNQKVFYIQDGIDYGIDGMACDPKQVKAHYAQVAGEAQKAADDAAAAAAAAQESATAILKETGVTKTAAKKAAG